MTAYMRLLCVKAPTPKTTLRELHKSCLFNEYAYFQAKT
jgi:hypothetical protein